MGDARSVRCAEYLDPPVDIFPAVQRVPCPDPAPLSGTSAARRQFTLERGLAMTDARREWISKRAYTLWEEAGRPHGHDAEHWEQAVHERDEFERVALAPETRQAGARKPLIEISEKAQAKKSEAAKSRKKAEAAAEKPIAAKAVAKAKSVKATTNGKQA